MTTVMDSIKARSKSHAGLFALVGNRFWPDRLTKNAEMPACKYSMVSPPESNHMTHDGPGRRKYRYQIDCYAETPDAAFALMVQVRTAFDGYHLGPTFGWSFVKNYFKADELELNLHRYVVEIVIDHKN